MMTTTMLRRPVVVEEVLCEIACFLQTILLFSSWLRAKNSTLLGFIPLSSALSYTHLNLFFFFLVNDIGFFNRHFCSNKKRKKISYTLHFHSSRIFMNLDYLILFLKLNAITESWVRLWNVKCQSWTFRISLKKCCEQDSLLLK